MRYLGPGVDAFPLPGGSTRQRWKKWFCGDDRDVKIKDNKKEVPWHGDAFPQSPCETRGNAEAGGEEEERGASGPQGQGGHQSCVWVNGEGISQVVLGRRLLLSAGISYLFLMPLLLCVIGTIVHDTDFFSKSF